MGKRKSAAYTVVLSDNEKELKGIVKSIRPVTVTHMKNKPTGDGADCTFVFADSIKKGE